jgi:hypothetical protein
MGEQCAATEATTSSQARIAVRLADVRKKAPHDDGAPLRRINGYFIADLTLPAAD